MEMMDREKRALPRRVQSFPQIALWQTLLCLGVGVALLAPLPVAHADTDPKAQMLLGNPDKATTSPTNREHFLIKRGQYALSYNDKLHFPNWVAWHLTAGDIGNTERGNFVPDPDLPGGFTRITTRDYTSSGYDRGHNVPSKDRSGSRQDNDIVFFMTNITPQQHGMNAGPWEGLEELRERHGIAPGEPGDTLPPGEGRRIVLRALGDVYRQAGAAIARQHGYVMAGQVVEDGPGARWELLESD